jgi:hypothetical protein
VRRRWSVPCPLLAALAAGCAGSPLSPEPGDGAERRTSLVCEERLAEIVRVAKPAVVAKGRPVPVDVSFRHHMPAWELRGLVIRLDGEVVFQRRAEGEAPFTLPAELTAFHGTLPEGKHWLYADYVVRRSVTRRGVLSSEVTGQCFHVRLIEDFDLRPPRPADLVVSARDGEDPARPPAVRMDRRR